MKPIIFNADMVRAILEGKKTVTRRAIKPKYRKDEGGFQVCWRRTDPSVKWVEKMDEDGGSFDRTRYINPPYRPGETLYMQEPWRCMGMFGETGYMVGFNDGQTVSFNFADKPRAEKWAKYGNKPAEHWQSPYFMPCEAARTFLKVTDARVEQLQDIDEEQAKAEGANFRVGIEDKFRRSAIDRFSEIWDSTIKPKDREKYGWDANPWVWVISFERIE